MDDRDMSRSIRIQGISDETYQRLAERAAEAGQSVPDLVRAEVEKLASRPSTREWLDRAERTAGPARTSDAVKLLDDARGPWSN